MTIDVYLPTLTGKKIVSCRYWVNKFSGERVYEDPTKDKKSLEQKNQANTE